MSPYSSRKGQWKFSVPFVNACTYGKTPLHALWEGRKLPKQLYFQWRFFNKLGKLARAMKGIK